MVALNPFTSARRVVVKIGSALLIDGDTGTLRADWLRSVAGDIADLRKAGLDVVIVSSGAVGLGRQRLALPGALSLAQKQACAAVGQTELTRAYEQALARHTLTTAQVLLTRNDTENRRRWLSSQRTMQTLLSLGAVPIVNENDTVSTDEIRYGDNDRLAARVAQLIGADTLILLSDIDGLYDDDPRRNPSAKHIPVIDTLTPSVMAMGGAPNAHARVGTGGMATKLLAAQMAVEAGCSMVVMDGAADRPITRLKNGAKASWFKAKSDPASARAGWIMGTLDPKGSVTCDGGAAAALIGGGSLLSVGITNVTGQFERGDTVRLISDTGEIGRGLVNYSATEIAKILGRNSRDIEDVLGYDNGAAVVHRDNMVLLSHD